MPQAGRTVHQEQRERVLLHDRRGREQHRPLLSVEARRVVRVGQLRRTPAPPLPRAARTPAPEGTPQTRPRRSAG